MFTLTTKSVVNGACFRWNHDPRLSEIGPAKSSTPTSHLRGALNNSVRLVYFDEAGSSQDESQEPIITVASVLLHGDLQTGPIEHEAAQIIASLVPNDLRSKYEFHGK